MQTFADKVSFTLMGNGLFTETFNKDAHLRIQIFFTHFQPRCRMPTFLRHIKSSIYAFEI